MKKTFFLLALLPFIFACSDDDNDDGFIQNPDFPIKAVHYQLTTAEGAVDDDLRDKGATKYLGIRQTAYDKLGLGTLIAYHSTKGIKVYDRACPVECSENWRVDTVPNTKTLHCNKCGSTYNLENGHPISGKAFESKYKLIEYTVTDRGASYILLVTNPKYKE